MNREIRKKYNSAISLMEDLNTLQSLGLIEITEDPETYEKGYRITRLGEKVFQEQYIDQIARLNQEADKTSIS